MSPAMNIVGFEHEPVNEVQRQNVAKALAALEDIENLFRPAVEAHCVAEPVRIDSPFEHHPEEEHQGEHKDFEITYTFNCEASDELGWLDVHLFEPFPGVEKIETQVISDKGQTAVDLTPGRNRIEF